MRRFLICVAYSMAWTGAAWAVDPSLLPQCNMPAGYYRVVNKSIGTGVDYFREPRHSSNHIQSFQAGAVVFSDGQLAHAGGETWVRVIDTPYVGWITKSHLFRTLPLTTNKTDMPVAGRCSDPTPLWSVNWSGEEFVLRLFPETHAFHAANVRSGDSGGTTLVTAEEGGAELTMVYREIVCSNAAGLPQDLGETQVILRANGETRLFTGCCHAKPESFARR